MGVTPWRFESSREQVAERVPESSEGQVKPEAQRTYPRDTLCLFYATVVKLVDTPA